MAHREGWAKLYAGNALLALAVLALDAGCPKCSPPVTVRLLEYACPSSPCHDLVEVESTSKYALSYSLDGGEEDACGGFSCGEGNGSCGAGEAGTYRVFARRDGRTWTAATEVEEDVCIAGGEWVELVVGEPPPPAPCLPIAADLAPVAGAVSWELDGWSGGFEWPGEPPAEVADVRAITGATVDAATDEVVVHDQVLVTLLADGRLLALRFALGDLRHAEASAGSVSLEGEGASAYAVLQLPCSGDGHCAAHALGAQATVEVEVAEGAAAPWPATVTPSYVRRFRLRFETADLLADGASTQGCDGCEQPLALSVDLTFERVASDFGLADDGHCRAE